MSGHKAKFKLGDKVRCIKGKHNHGWEEKQGGEGWKEGLEFVVTEVSNLNGDDDNDLPIYWQGDDDCGVYEDWLELATPKVPVKPVRLGKWGTKL